MIYTVEINPKINYRFNGELSVGSENCFDRPEVVLGGSASKLSRVISTTSDSCVLLTVLGNDNGALQERLLRECGVKFNALRIRDDIQTVYSFGKGIFKTTVCDAKARISIGEQEAFIDMCNKQFSSGNNVLLICEQDYSEQQSKILFEIGKYAAIEGLDIFVTADAKHFDEVIKFKPKAIVADVSQIEEFYDLKISFESELIKIMHAACESGVKYFGSFWKDKVLMILNSCGYRIYSDEMELESMAFSDDLFMAGLCVADERKLSIEAAMLYASALAFSAQVFDCQDIDSGAVKELMRKLKIEEFNL